MTSKRMARCNHSTASKLINDLMSCLFTVEEMVTSSMYGQDCNIHKKDGQTTNALNPDKVCAMKGKYEALLYKIRNGK